MTIKGYIPGDYLMSCDRCGLTFRRSQIRRDGNVKGLMVCRSCWDFKATYPSPPPDRMSVPVARPDNTSVVANGTTYAKTTIGENIFPEDFSGGYSDNLLTGAATASTTSYWTSSSYSDWYEEDLATISYTSYDTIVIDYAEHPEATDIFGTTRYRIGDIIRINGADITITDSGFSGLTGFYISMVTGGDGATTLEYRNQTGEWTCDGLQSGTTTVSWQTTQTLDGVLAKITGRIISIESGNISYVLEASGTPVVRDSVGTFTDTQTGPYPAGQNTLVITASNDFKGVIALDTAYDTANSVTLSQEHVRYGTTSIIVDNKTIHQPISGLTIGVQYRLQASTWTPDTASVLIDDIDIGMFSSVTANEWVDDLYIFIAESENITISFVGSENTSWYDGFYLQAYSSEEIALTTSEIIENKKPVDEIDDKTIYPDPVYIGYSDINIFPDPTVSDDPTSFVRFNKTGIAISSASRSTDKQREGTHSLKLGIISPGTIYGGASIPLNTILSDTQYRLKFWIYDSLSPAPQSAGFGSNGNALENEILVADHHNNEWVETDYYTFTTPVEITDDNIYFGYNSITYIGTAQIYYDSFILNQYINKTTPF